jgi:hypothetical protein
MRMPKPPPTSVPITRWNDLRKEAPASAWLTVKMVVMAQWPWGNASTPRATVVRTATREATTMRRAARRRPGVGASSRWRKERSVTVP